VIFVDTSFWIALENTRDAHHATAAALLGTTADTQLVTSNHVQGEAWTWLRRRAGHHHAVRFLDRIDRSRRLQVVHMGEELEERAWAWLRTHDEREYSFVDAASFALMRSMKIKDALAFDGDFSAAGFRELRPL
jgi:predicted nucleic acid-binding protein